MSCATNKRPPPLTLAPLLKVPRLEAPNIRANRSRANRDRSEKDRRSRMRNPSGIPPPSCTISCKCPRAANMAWANKPIQWDNRYHPRKTSYSNRQERSIDSDNPRRIPHRSHTPCSRRTCPHPLQRPSGQHPPNPRPSMHRQGCQDRSGDLASPNLHTMQ